MNLLRSDIIRVSVVSGTVGALVAGGVAWAIAESAQNSSAVPTAEASTASLALAAPANATSSDVTTIVARSVRSVVSVKAVKAQQASFSGHRLPGIPFGFGVPDAQREQQGVGSGVIVRADGIVLTNNHVVADAKEITVITSSGEELVATVLGSDAKTDLAVLRVNAQKKPLEPLPMGRSDALKLGEPVLAIGNPFGVGQTVTQGIVSAKGRADLGINANEDFIQTDAAINPGNSGGALVNMRGELVGINTAILSRSGGNMGIGFAIPSDMARPIMTSLIEKGHVDRGWLGVSIQDIPPDMAEALDLGSRRGVLVADVEKDSPAQRGGVARGDVVLTVNARPTETTGQLRNAIALAGGEKKVALVVWRDGKELTFGLKLGTMSDTAKNAERFAPADTHGESSALDGARLSTLDDSWRTKLSLPDTKTDGVVVTQVLPGSAAERTGLRRGDVIVEVDRIPVDGVEGFAKLWTPRTKAKRLLLVQRGAQKLFLVAKD